ncbi:MAG: type II secretion system protein GspC [Myxococcota bacterium]
MSNPAERRFQRGIVLVTLTLCAFFLAQGATALIGARVLSADGEAGSPGRRRLPVASARQRHDPGVILKRNIFNSEMGDLTQIEADPDAEFVDGELVVDDEESVDRCATQLKLKGTAVVPGDFERSLAVIVGSDRQALLYQGGQDVEGSRIRAIHSDGVFLQSGGELCRLAMFDQEDQPKKTIKAPSRKVSKKDDDKDKKKRVKVDRNAGLTDEEIDAGIEKVSDTVYNIDRTMLNKVLDSAGRLIGIAAVSPKMEGGKSVGMQIRGIRPKTLLEKLGIKNQDVLEAVNGSPLASPDAALGAYTTLRTADKFVLAVNRGGESMEITYNLN